MVKCAAFSCHSGHRPNKEDRKLMSQNTRNTFSVFQRMKTYDSSGFAPREGKILSEILTTAVSVSFSLLMIISF